MRVQGPKQDRAAAQTPSNTLRYGYSPLKQLPTRTHKLHPPLIVNVPRVRSTSVIKKYFFSGVMHLLFIKPWMQTGGNQTLISSQLQSQQKVWKHLQKSENTAVELYCYIHTVIVV